MKTHPDRWVIAPVALLILAALACTAPGWSAPTASPSVSLEGQVSPSPAEIGTAVSTPPGTVIPSVTPSAAATNTPVPDVVGPGGCTLNAKFVKDVTVPDDTQFTPGTAFAKVWRVRNTGTCTWEQGTQLAFAGDDPMGGPVAVDVQAVAPDAEVDIRVDLVAPAPPGTYKSTWQLQTKDGLRFGDRIWVRIITAVTPTPSPTPTVTPTQVFSVTQPFAAVWQATGGAGGSLGAPTMQAKLNHPAGEQQFQFGTMYWRNAFGSSPSQIFALVQAGPDVTTGTWSQYQDKWVEGSVELSCPEAVLPNGPKRGFGKVWCENPAVRTALGNATDAEQGSFAAFQEFKGGTLLWSSRLNYVYALLTNGTWKRFAVTP